MDSVGDVDGEVMNRFREVGGGVRCVRLRLMPALMLRLPEDQDASGETRVAWGVLHSHFTTRSIAGERPVTHRLRIIGIRLIGVRRALRVRADPRVNIHAR
ncbi:hypothetical protein JCM10599A_27240 [Paraburkholderia kururiensis]